MYSRSCWSSGLALSLTLLVIPLLSCHRDQSQSHPASEASWEQRAWLDKAVRALLYGKARLTPAEEEHLLGLSREAAVDELMARPEFFDTVLDFNLYFQGSKLESLKPFSGKYGQEATQSIPAIIAAMEVSQGGDYFTLFDWKIPYLIGTEVSAPFPSVGGKDKKDDIKGLSSDQIRSLYIERAENDLFRLREKAEKTTDLKALCDEIDDPEREDSFANYIDALALPPPFDGLSTMSFEFSLECGFSGLAPAPENVLRATIAKDLDQKLKLTKEIPALVKRLPTSVKQIKEFVRIEANEFSFGDVVKRENFSSSMWQELPNSSTNFNRRRAAYMLRTYFCDDLTPINIVAPSGMSSHKHASDAGCAACHYKLDPMAGFFRYRGFSGVDFNPQKSDLLIHDDLFQRSGDDLKNYLDNWRSSDPARAWNVGYVRSATKAKLNEYGDSLDDLFAIIRRVRESKVCLTKKMASYVLGADQVYDGSWIDSLAEKFQQAAQADAPPGASSQAFKDVYKSFVLSKTFSTPDPELGQCYDFPAGVKPSGLPCAVSFIIEKNCASCHKGTGAPAGLDLSIWEDQGGGKMGFHHIDKDSGQALPMATTLERMKERLTSSDVNRQMPLMRAMGPVERASLFKWIDSQLRGNP